MGTVVAFPHGSSTTATKVSETTQVISDGAEEVDMVIDIARFRDGGDDFTAAEIAAVVEAAEEHRDDARGRSSPRSASSASSARAPLRDDGSDMTRRDGDASGQSAVAYLAVSAEPSWSTRRRAEEQ